MRYRKPLLVFLFIFSPFLILVHTSCEKFSGDQTIPAYISIDSIYLSTDYSTQGTSSHNITDAWVYVDDDLVGTFQMPVRFPVLKQGMHKVSILPGIKKNGIAATRINYPFFTPIVQTINFIPDSTFAFNRQQTSYESTADFPWMEDFEDVSISLDTTSRSLANIEETPSASPYTFEGQHSGMILMDSARNFFEATTHNAYNIPASPVYLEMNFNTNNPMSVGVYIYTSLYVYQVPVITLLPTNNAWKKIYIDLTTTLNSYSGSQNFKVFLGNFKDAGVAQAIVLVDNFKLVMRK